MNPIVETTSAATLAALGVALFKMAWATAPSWALVTAALLIGVSASFLVSAAGGDVWTQPVIATTIMQGLFAAAGAAGVSRTDERANIVRTNAQMEARRTGLADEPAGPPRAV
jgi:hypothetical protein